MKSLLFALAVCGVAWHSLAAAEDPSYYHQSKAGWHESLLASLEAVAGSGVQDGFTPFESATLRGGETAQAISVPVAGAKSFGCSSLACRM